MSGQNVNLSKFKILLSNSLSDSFCQSVCLELGVSIMGNSLYLGIPLPLGKWKMKVFWYLIHRMHKKTNGWGDRLLYKARKLVIIQSILQSLPTYILGDSGEITKGSWIKIPSIGRNGVLFVCPQTQGGLGFLDLMSFNKALLAKQV